MNVVVMSLLAIGWSVLTNIAMEAYRVRRAMEQVGEHDAP
jgi:hypothetical protein